MKNTRISSCTTQCTTHKVQNCDARHEHFVQIYIWNSAHSIDYIRFICAPKNGLHEFSFSILHLVHELTTNSSNTRISTCTTRWATQHTYCAVARRNTSTLVSTIYMQRCLLNSLHELWLLTAKLCPIFSLSLAFASTCSLSTCKQAWIHVKKACYFNTCRARTPHIACCAAHGSWNCDARHEHMLYIYIYVTLSTRLTMRFFGYLIHWLHELTWELIQPVRHAVQHTNYGIVMRERSAS